MRNEKVYEWLKDRGFENRLTEHSETIDKKHYHLSWMKNLWLLLWSETVV